MPAPTLVWKSEVGSCRNNQPTSQPANQPTSVNQPTSQPANAWKWFGRTSWTAWEWSLGLLIAGFIGFLGAFAWINYQVGGYAWDFAIFDQGTWLLSRFTVPFVTARGLHLLGDHLSLILVLLSPLYWVWPDGRVLQWIQALALGLAAIPVYRLAVARLQSRAAAWCFAAAFLNYAALQYLAVNDFHPDAVATGCLLFALWFMQEARWRAFWITLGLALLCKESVGLTVAMMGVWLFLRGERKRGLIAALGGLTWLLLATCVICPRLSNQGYEYSHLYFANLGETPGEIVQTLIRRPSVAAQTLWTAANGKYLRDLLLPWSGLSLLGPAALLPALPTLLINLLSGWEPMHIIQFQYTAFLILFFTASAIQGAARVFHWGVERVHSWRPDRPREYGRRLTLTALCYLLLMGNVLSHSPLALGGLWTQRRNELRQGGKERAAFLQTVRSLPPEAAVSASSHYLTLVTHRRRAYLFPNPAWPYRWGGQVMYEPQVTPEETAERLRRSGIDYVILNPRNPWPLKKKDFRACLEDVERSDLFEVVARYQTSVLFRRVRTERAQKEDKG